MGREALDSENMPYFTSLTRDIAGKTRKTAPNGDVTRRDRQGTPRGARTVIQQGRRYP